MSAKELIELLAWCPSAIDVIITGRGALAKVSVSIMEDVALPEGWRPVAENKAQWRAGWKRAVWARDAGSDGCGADQ